MASGDGIGLDALGMKLDDERVRMNDEQEKRRRQRREGGKERDGKERLTKNGTYIHNLSFIVRSLTASSSQMESRRARWRRRRRKPLRATRRGKR